MNWNSFSEFIAMGGYATYVWGSMAMVALCVGTEMVLLRQRRRSVRALLESARALDAMRSGRPS